MLALIAGQGQLPVFLADRLDARAEPFRIFSLSGFEIDADSGRKAESFRIEQLGSFLDRLVSDGFDEVCFAGAIRRPPVEPDRIDAATRPLVPRILAAIALGDDGALRVVLDIFEERGLRVRAAQDLAPELLLKPGVPTRCKPEKGHLQDATVGDAILDQLGKDDQGQACVIARGREIARENIEGTDAMLAGIGRQAAAGILFKGPKPGQDRRIDMPTIGPRTVQAAHAAGLAGIVVAAGGVLVLDAETVIRECDRTGLFLLVRGQG